MEHVSHEMIKPVYDQNSKILILGSMPSRKSREAAFYYMHPQNRFWRILETLLKESSTDKIAFLKKHHIALWDTITTCDIIGASDASIKNVIPNKIEEIVAQIPNIQIFTAGKTAHKLYYKYNYPKTKKEAICLPSTSPANCRISMEEMLEKWSIILNYL